MLIKDSDIFLSEEIATELSTKMNSKAMSLTDCTIQKFITVLPFQLKQTLDCQSKKKFQFHVLGDEYTSKNQFTQYLQSLLGCRPFSRRNLAGQSFPTILAASASAPTVEPPTYSSPSLDPTPPSSLAPNDSFPAEVPHAFSPPDPHDSSLQPSTSPVFAPAIPSKHNGAVKRAVLIAVLATAAGTFLFVAILFWCYKKCCRDLIMGDDRPLLTVNISDFSVGKEALLVCVIVDIGCIWMYPHFD